MVVSLPLDESRRLEVLRAGCVLDTPAEERFDRLVRLASRVTGCPIATIGLVDDRREWFKASVGWQHPQLARELSFGSHVVSTGEALVLEDARADARFRNNPLVSSDPGVRFYAGEPLVAGDGSVLGTFALIDIRPRQRGEVDFISLRDLAAIAASEIAVSRLSPAQTAVASAASRDVVRIDSLTRLWNHSAMLDILAREAAHASTARRPLALLVVDVDGLRFVNEREGHDAGDETLRNVARILRASLRPYDSIGRVGGEEFAAVLPDAGQEAAVVAADRIRNAIRREIASGNAAVSVTIGAASSPPGAANGEALLRAAELALARAKKLGGDAVGV